MPVLFIPDARAQVLQPARWEYELKFSEEAFSMISLKEEGLALVRSKEKYHAGKKIWELVILDSALNRKWESELELNENLDFTGYEYVPGKVNLMFRNHQTDVLKAEMLMIDLYSQNIQYSKTEIKLSIRLTHYTIVDGSSVFGGYVGKEPVLVIYDPVKDNNFIVPGFFLTDTELLDVRSNGNGTFNILLSQRTQGKKKIIFRTFDRQGNILIEDEIPIDEEKIILSGVSSVLEHDEVLIAGAFGFNNAKQAAGIFSCLIDPFSEQPVQYIEFHQLQHFLDYLPDKKAGKIRAKATQRENYGRPPEYRANVSTHRIEEFKGGFALFGESYELSTASSGNAFSNPYYNPTSRTYYGNPYYSPFSSRYYNNPYLYQPNLAVQEMRMQVGFTIAFDFKGRRMWDYSIPMEDYKIQGRDQVADFTIIQNTPHFLYKSNNELKFSNHKTDTLQITEASSIPIKLKDEFEESKSANEYDGNVRHWFGTYFYVWGTQEIKDLKRRSNDSNRRVFFINKIKID